MKINHNKVNHYLFCEAREIHRSGSVDDEEAGAFGRVHLQQWEDDGAPEGVVGVVVGGVEGAGVGGQTRRVGAARPQQRRGRQLRRQRAHHRRRPIAAASASMSKKTAINFLFKPQFETPPKRGLFVGGGPHFDSIWKNSRLYHR